MGTHGNQFVNVTSTQAESADVSREITAWLRAQGYATPSPDGGPDLRTELPAPRAIDSPYIEVESGKYGGYACPDGYAGPRCIRCGEYREDLVEDDGSWMERWHAEGRPPILGCPGCGWTAPADEWDLEYAAALGWNAVLTTPLLEPEAFRDELNATGTGRWVYVYMHL